MKVDPFPAHLNDRRIDLIIKKYRHGLDATEAAELEDLRDRFFAALEALHPRDTETLDARLDRIEARLRKDKPC